MASAPLGAVRATRRQVILEYAQKHVPHYASVGKDWLDVPLVTKREYRADCERFMSDDVPRQAHMALRALLSRAGDHASGLPQEVIAGRFFWERSSGTSGPVFWYPRSNAERVSAAFSLLKARRIISPQFQQSGFFDLSKWLEEMREKKIASSPAIIADGLTAMISGKSHIYGRVSLLCAIARELNKEGRTIPIPIVETAGEHLTGEARAAVAAAFRCNVISQYGCRESWAIGYSNDGTLYSIMNDSVYVELVGADGSPINTCETEGCVAVTSLVFTSFPIIRFVTGDIGRWVERGREISLSLSEARDIELFCNINGVTAAGRGLFKRIIEGAKSPAGRPVMFDWKVRGTHERLVITLSYHDLDCAPSILSRLRDFACIKTVNAVTFETWDGWRIDDKRVLYSSAQ